jgi:hypothetical protein
MAASKLAPLDDGTGLLNRIAETGRAKPIAVRICRGAKNSDTKVQ